MKKKEKEESVKEAQKLENILCVKPNRRREEEGRTNLIGVSFYPYSHLQCNKKKSNSYNEKVYS